MHLMPGGHTSLPGYSWAQTIGTRSNFRREKSVFRVFRRQNKTKTSTDLNLSTRLMGILVSCEPAPEDRA